MDLDTLKSKLNIRLGDSDNFAFTDDEKELMLIEAIEDPYVTESRVDATLTYSQGTFEYELPDELSTVKDVYIKYGTTADPETVALPYDIIGNATDGRFLRFKKGSVVIPDGQTIYLRGNYKFTSTDTIDDVRLQNYILNVAQLNAMDSVGIKKILKFVKNDTSVSEIIAMKRELERKVAQHRASIPREFQAA